MVFILFKINSYFAKFQYELKTNARINLESILTNAAAVHLVFTEDDQL